MEIQMEILKSIGRFVKYSTYMTVVGLALYGSLSLARSYGWYNDKPQIGMIQGERTGNLEVQLGGNYFVMTSYKTTEKSSRSRAKEKLVGCVTVVKPSMGVGLQFADVNGKARADSPDIRHIPTIAMARNGN